MTEIDELGRISQLLDKVSSLHMAFGADPQVIWMQPAAGTTDQRVLFVGIFVVEKALRRDILAPICSRIIGELGKAAVLGGGAGLEILCCVSRGGTTERALRLQVQSGALANAELLTAEDLAKEHPSEGITCTLYKHTVR